jgi:Protein of unknown function (DUF2948).
MTQPKNDAVMEPLKLIALDRDDLEVISAHLQDSAVKVSDVYWLPKEKRLVLGVDRFDWLTPTRPRNTAAAAPGCASSGCFPARRAASIPPTRTRC